MAALSMPRRLCVSCTSPGCFSVRQGSLGCVGGSPRASAFVIICGAVMLLGGFSCMFCVQYETLLALILIFCEELTSHSLEQLLWH